MRVQYPNQSLVISHQTLIQAIGWLGISLPFTLLIGNYIINKFNLFNNHLLVKPSCSIYYTSSIIKHTYSHYYYTGVGNLFCGTLITIAVLLFCYKGYSQHDEEIVPSDSFMTNLAGTCVLGIVIFPTSASYCIEGNVRTYISSEIIGCLHYTFAGFLFFTLSFISLINFRRTEKNEDFGKLPSHNFYKYCGIVKLICVALIVIYVFWIEYEYPELQEYKIIFILQSIALIAFGLAWLKKGKAENN